ncbi:dicarboxylate/amino acid:cation symporter [Geomonas sp.]|uniref:dicarboxylate/amino acid:cation symporter n=1 Tax=Geomonas sp. TaxID=2651584 RepID=UPI002B49B7D5|nr:dicarboxylate/amino acid:cation symporter [Geomonas sp.]HJV35186.1 dicarboxylate/amino acid:cation symporter [Geomonas sp.]
MKKNRLTICIMAGMLLGIVVGYICNVSAPDAKAAKEIAGYFSLITDIFLRLIKMVIGPLVFATLTAGIASMGDSKAVGRIGFKALGWFLCASLASLFIGMIFVNVLQPGHAMNLALPAAGAATDLKTSSLNLKDFLTHVFPKSFFDAMANNEILQILVFSVFLGFAIGSLKERAQTVLKFIDELGHVMLKVTDSVMMLAPIGVFAAIAAVVTTQGLGILVTYGKFISGFYLSMAALWVVLIGGGAVFLGKRIFILLKMVQSPMVLAFCTASSEAAFPKTLEQLKKFGASDKIAGFVLPLGYSFNLDGSMIYQAFAMIFIAQAFNIELSISKQITILLVLMLTSKGTAGVARSSLVVVAATLPMFNLPESGLLLIMGIDQFLDMGRTLTNVIGNSIATAVVAKWEGALGEVCDEDALEVEEEELLAMPTAVAE